MPKHGAAELQFQHAPAVQQYTFELSPGVSRNDPRRHAYRLLATVLGDDSGSRTFWALVDPGLAESAGMFAHEYDECGIMGLFLTCTPEDTQSNWDTLVEIIRQQTDKKISERELTVAKNKICSSLVLSSERPGNRLFTVGNAMTLRGVYETVDDSIENYRRVDLDAVHKAWKDYVTQSGARVTIGPELNVLN